MTTTTTPVDVLLARPDVGSALDIAFSGVAQSVGEKLSATFTKWIRAGKPPKRAEMQKELAVALDAVLGDEFFVRLIDDGAPARQRRAALMALLSAAEFPGTTFSVIAHDNDDELLTSEQAAELLHVSRTHVNKLMDSGTLKNVSRTEGRHRRVPKASVMAYKAESKARQAKGMERMTEASRRLGLYEAELAGIPKPPKRR